MPDQAALDAAVASVTAAVQKIGADLTTTITDLKNKIGTGVDPTSAIAGLEAAAQSLTDFDATVVAADPGV